MVTQKMCLYLARVWLSLGPRGPHVPAAGGGGGGAGLELYYHFTLLLYTTGAGLELYSRADTDGRFKAD